VANDLDQSLENCSLVYEVTREGEVMASGNAPAQMVRCSPSSHGVIAVHLPDVPSRTLPKVSVSLLDSAGTAIHDSELTLEVFPKLKTLPSKVFVFGDETLGAWILEGLGIESFKGPIEEAEVVLVTDSRAYLEAPQKVNAAVRRGAMAVLFSLSVGENVIGSQSIGVRQAGIRPRHFVSCDSGHPLVAGFHREDFKFWFDENLGHASPILSTVLEAGAVRWALFPLPLNTLRESVVGVFAKSKYTIGSAPIHSCSDNVCQKVSADSGNRKHALIF
jgi:hypothetical protein